MVSEKQRLFMEQRQALLSRLSKDPLDRGALEEYGRTLAETENLTAGYNLLRGGTQQPGPAKGRCSCCNERDSFPPTPFCELCRDTIHFHCAFCKKLVSYLDPLLDLDKCLLICDECETLTRAPAEDLLINDCRELLAGYLWVRAYHAKKSQAHDRCVQRYATFISAPFDALWFVQLLTDSRCDFFRRHSLLMSLDQGMRETYESFLLADGPAPE
ncbi:MAG: hypothetical protein P1V97_07345 [Planctomycetota bacterium]|nr:hypothetical protein [Planctomycetota bacterium]